MVKKKIEKRNPLMQHNLNENIKKYRKEMNLTQADLAEAFGITEGAVSKWESGNTVPEQLHASRLMSRGRHGRKPMPAWRFRWFIRVSYKEF